MTTRAATAGKRLQMTGAALLLAAALAVSAHAGRVIADHRPTPLAASTPGRDGDDHFPGAALLYLDADGAAPAKGATGTAPLPAMPAAAFLPVVADLPGQGARPFLSSGAPAMRGRALECLAAAIYYEAASEPDAGQQAVAQVVLNRVRHPAFPDSVCGVVYQGSERTSGCQFSFACDGAMTRVPSRGGWARATRAAAMALSGRVYAPVGLATHYHTFAVTPSWNRSLVMTDAVGAHFFHRWKGYWGTAAAFTRRYAGIEPLPGPHARGTPPTPLVVAVTAPVPVTPAVLIQPLHAESGSLLPATVAAGESQVLERWKDAGKPLR